MNVISFVFSWPHTSENNKKNSLFSFTSGSSSGRRQYGVFVVLDTCFVLLPSTRHKTLDKKEQKMRRRRGAGDGSDQDDVDGEKKGPLNDVVYSAYGYFPFMNNVSMLCVVLCCAARCVTQFHSKCQAKHFGERGRIIRGRCRSGGGRSTAELFFLFSAFLLRCLPYFVSPEGFSALAVPCRHSNRILFRVLYILLSTARCCVRKKTQGHRGTHEFTYMYILRIYSSYIRSTNYCYLAVVHATAALYGVLFFGSLVATTTNCFCGHVFFSLFCLAHVSWYRCTYSTHTRSTSFKIRM